MKDNINLTEGKITTGLIKLALPIIATNFIQTAYGMVDMIWVGKLGSKAVAAVGTASFFINLALALFAIIMIGSGVKIAQSVGANKKEETLIYIKNSFILSVILAVVYSILIVVLKNKLIGFFQLNDIEIEKMAKDFLVYSAVGVIFMYFNSIQSTILNSFGNSKLPFKANTIGFITNIILDPILIFGIGPVAGMGVAGAAIATNLSRIIVFIIFIFTAKEYFSFKGISVKFDFIKAKEVLKMGMPVSLQRVSFIGISIIIARLITSFGATAIAVQKVGVQLESVSYMAIGGIQGAIAAYVGQNYGAKKYKRIEKGYFSALTTTIIFGLIISIIFILFPKELFSIFIQEKAAVDLGTSYMRILGFSQVFMCMELLTVGAFNGVGKTYVPPIISIAFTALRIPMAMILSKDSILGLNGIWASISLSSLIKGIILVTWFIIFLRKTFVVDRSEQCNGTY
ncbi:MATE family efflux transporter [Clostridium sp. YIM B02551]|uniref:MATE family efflux transporter n=1 Tax=Clostridium sp. YIM B02551 TaxID=2910679 RepID=UPI001EE9FDEE|nr:MATE family efflux transporter [Clostridium sp. YIM B02551]